MEKIIEKSWFRTVVASKGTVVTLFSGEFYKSNDYRKNLHEFIDYIIKPNVNKIHLIFDYTCCNANKRGGIDDWAFRSNIGTTLDVIYSNNSNVRVIIHAYGKLFLVFKDMEYVKRDLHYIPRVVTDIDHSQPLYFQIGKYNYAKIICKHDKFIYTIVDKMYD